MWHSRIPPTSIAVFSGGTEGALNPHVTFVVKEQGGESTGVVALVGRTRKFEPEEVGSSVQVREVEKTIKGMMGTPCGP